MIGPISLRLCSLGSSQTLAQLGDARVALPLLCERLASQDRSPNQHQPKPLFGRDRNDLFCLLLSDGPLPTKVMKPG